MKPRDKDFSDLKVGDRINMYWMGLIIKNLLVTSVNEKCLTLEHLYPFTRKTGASCDLASDLMHLVRGET